MKKNQLRKIFVFVLLITLIFTGCGSKDVKETTKANNTSNTVKEMSTRSTSLTVKSGSLSIDRNERETETTMGEDGTWTLFVYLCGTDLESGQQSATMDLEEMMAATQSGKIKVVVETGGCKDWGIDGISTEKINRFVLSDGQLELVDEVDGVSMGESSTLSDFLTWGVENYSAKNMGAILWNHGSGSINGVCFDENYKYDSLSLPELDTAFTSVYEKMSTKFEFVGFDACLMASIETANIFVPHANYLIASEETESGYGWDYEAILNYLSKNSGADGKELGKVICDSYYASCEKSGEDSVATLSVIDLSKIDSVLTNFDATMKEIDASCAQDKSFLATVSRGASKAENYGGNTDAEGYTNMIDLRDMMTQIQDESTSAAKVIDALDSTLVYQVKGDDCKNAGGLSIYYPLQVSDAEEISVLQSVCVSPNYLNYIDKIVYGGTNGSLDDYTIANWTQTDSGFYSQDVQSNENYWGEYFENFTQSSFSALNEESSIQLAKKPYINDEGYYTMSIDKDSLDLVQNVWFSVFCDYDENYILDLGSGSDVATDFNSGVVEDNFVGYWATLPDGQFLTMNIISESEDYEICSSPILYNGEEMNLRIKMNYQTDGSVTYEVLGVWEGIDSESGEAGRSLGKLKTGDKIAPLYTIYNINNDDDEGEWIYGDECVVDEAFSIEDTLLMESNYYYSFEIVDIFGNSQYTDATTFYLDNEGEVYFEDSSSDSEAGAVYQLFSGN